MVICPIARMVHCTGCVLVKFCPLKTIIGDYGKVDGEEKEIAEVSQTSDEKPPHQSTEPQ